MQYHQIHYVNLLEQFENQKLQAFVLKSRISFSYKGKQNKFRGYGLLDLLILNLKLVH